MSGHSSRASPSGAGGSLPVRLFCRPEQSSEEAEKTEYSGYADRGRYALDALRDREGPRHESGLGRQWPPEVRRTGLPAVVDVGGPGRCCGASPGPVSTPGSSPGQGQSPNGDSPSPAVPARRIGVASCPGPAGSGRAAAEGADRRRTPTSGTGASGSAAALPPPTVFALPPSSTDLVVPRNKEKRTPPPPLRRPIDVSLIPGRTIEPIDLPSALKLTGARDLDIAIARQRVYQAVADLEGAARCGCRRCSWDRPGIERTGRSRRSPVRSRRSTAARCSSVAWPRRRPPASPPPRRGRVILP